MESVSTLDELLLALRGGSLSVGNLDSTSSLEEVLLALRATSLVLGDVESTSSLANVVLALRSGQLVVAALSSASSIASVVIGNLETFNLAPSNDRDVSALIQNWGSYSGGSPGDLSETLIYAHGGYSTNDESYFVSRAGLNFDLSSLSGKTISSAKLVLTRGSGTAEGDGRVILCKGTWSDITTFLDLSNYGVAISSQSANITTDNTAYEIPITDLTYLQDAVGGTVKIGIKSYDYDYLNSAPASDQDTGKGGIFHSKEATTSSYRPKLVIEAS
jgi:hypothetical protein